MTEKVGLDIYFAGSYNKDAEQVLYASGAHRLASQLLDKKVISEWIAARESGRATGKLFIDSGAFSAHTQGTELDVDGYIEFINAIDEHIVLAAQVDKIPGRYKEPKTVEQLTNAPAESWQNYLYMRPRLTSPQKLVPIHHQGEDEKWLLNLLEWTDENGQHIPYIGLSPANDRTTKEKERYLERCRDLIAASSNPNVKTHCFGLMTINVLDHIPLTSADSTTWLLAASFGGIMSDKGVVTLSKRRDFAAEYIFRQPKAAQAAVRKMVEARGFDWARLCDEADYKYRMEYNIKYLVDRQRTLRCKTSGVKRRKLF